MSVIYNEQTGVSIIYVPTGAPGPAGPTGPAGGPQGEPGLDGPAGPSAVSTDAGQIATIGTDGLILVVAPSSGSGEWRHEFATPYSYCGTAPSGTLDSVSPWILTRITVNEAGAVTATATAIAAWDDRATATYA